MNPEREFCLWLSGVLWTLTPEMRVSLSKAASKEIRERLARAIGEPLIVDRERCEEVTPRLGVYRAE